MAEIVTAKDVEQYKKILRDGTLNFLIADEGSPLAKALNKDNGFTRQERILPNRTTKTFYYHLRK